MPQVVTVRVRRTGGRRVRLWVPVLPVLAVLSPLLVLVLMLVALALAAASLADRPHPGAARLRRTGPPGFPVGSALVACARLVWALHGTRIEIEQGRTAVLVSLW